MSEIYQSVRLAIRDSVTRILFDRPGQWLTTAELLNHCEEAETSDTLAKILSDMAKTGRLMRGLKTLNSQGREVNTWGLAPKLRDKITSGQLLAQSLELLAQSQDAGHDAPAPAWQIDAPQTSADVLPLPAESREDEAPPAPARVGYTLPAATLTSTGTTASARCTGDPWDKRPYAPLPWTLAGDDAPESSEPDQPLDTPPASPEAATDIHFHPLPERWLPELRLRLLGYDDRDDPVITLRVSTEGHGAYLTLSTHGQIAFDPGELDFLPSIGTALCQFIDALYPYGTRPTAAATTPSAPEAQP